MASKMKLHVHIIKKEANEFELVALSIDKVVWFDVPERLKNIHNHKELLAHKTFTSKMKDIKKIGGYRKIKITLSPELQQKYLDEEGILCINDQNQAESLEEASAVNDQGDSKLSNAILSIVEELKTRLSLGNEVKEIEQKFSVDVFNGEQEASTWINKFEEECIRLKIIDGKTKVEVLKTFIDGNVKEWYTSNVIKLSLSDWEAWKKSFLLIYGRKTWESIRAAFNYKYESGSLINFVVTKERLLLEADNSIPELFRIYQIVFNLPLDVQDRLDRYKINTIDDLIKELKRFNDSYTIKKKLEEKRFAKEKKNKE